MGSGWRGHYLGHRHLPQSYVSCFNAPGVRGISCFFRKWLVPSMCFEEAELKAWKHFEQVLSSLAFLCTLPAKQSEQTAFAKLWRMSSTRPPAKNARPLLWTVRSDEANKLPPPTYDYQERSESSLRDLAPWLCTNRRPWGVGSSRTKERGTNGKQLLGTSASLLGTSALPSCY